MPRGPLVFSALLFMLGYSLQADVIVFHSGTVLTQKILQEDKDGILVQMDYGTIRYPASSVKTVTRDKTSILEAETPTRIPEWSKIISALAKKEWAHELKQIPATVIESGVLKDVPYISFRCNSGGYEINIYGDLDKPACVEVGTINYLVKNDGAKNNCVRFISSVLTAEKDQNLMRLLDLKQKSVLNREGLTFETTLPDEPDAYGGWWVSVYDESALTNARAAGPELLTITQPRVIEKTFVAEAAPRQVAAPVAAPAWTPTDLSYSRATAETPSYSGGRVYVRGYTRKDGTYVSPHTRSAPRR